VKRNFDANPVRSIDGSNFEIPFEDLFIFEDLILRRPM